jgi:(2Fe-2S) ferredoxin
VIPPHERHVLPCLGPRCTSRGAGGLYEHFYKRLQERELLRGRSGVHAGQTGCLSPCNLGPTTVVYPEGIWYCGLIAEATDRIVDEHFVGGRVVEEYAREPRRHERLKGDRYESMLRGKSRAKRGCLDFAGLGSDFTSSSEAGSAAGKRLSGFDMTRGSSTSTAHRCGGLGVVRSRLLEGVGSA